VSAAFFSAFIIWLPWRKKSVLPLKIFPENGKINGKWDNREDS